MHKHYGKQSKYNAFLNATLREALETTSEVFSPKEILSLHEEVCLAREVAGHSIQQYAIIRHKYQQYLAENKIDGTNTIPNDQTAKTLYNLMLNAGEQLKAQLQDVAKIVEQAARVDNYGKDKFSLQQLDYFVNNIVQCIYDTLGVNSPQTFQLEQLIRETMALPGHGNTTNTNSRAITGTVLTPDKDVTAMDSSIPGEETPAPGPISSDIKIA